MSRFLAEVRATLAVVPLVQVVGIFGFLENLIISAQLVAVALNVNPPVVRSSYERRNGGLQ